MKKNKPNKRQNINTILKEKYENIKKAAIRTTKKVLLKNDYIKFLFFFN